jgi:hypothetical protein
MIPHGLRCFGRESPAPIIRIKPISNFDFFCSIHLLMKKTAVADQSIIAAMHDRKLRWKPTTLPSIDFVKKGTGLLPCKNAE